MRRTIGRRQFIQAGALAAAGFGTASAGPVQSGGKEDAQPLRVADPHVHLWDLDRFRLPWIEKGTPLARSFVLKDYLTAVDGLNVVKAVYMEVDVDPKQHVAEAEYVLDLCRQANSPLVGAVIGGRPASDDFAAYVRRFRGNRFLKGVRQVLHTNATAAGFCLQPGFVRGVQVLGERGLCYELCMRPTDLGDAVRLIEACPDVRFVLDHCGNGPVQAKDRTQWRRDMERLARHRNIVCKVSGIVVQARERWRPEDLAPVINHTLDTFGRDRVMFAGDWPVCTLRATYRRWLDALKEIVSQRPREDRRKLFYDNAVRFYGLN